MQLRVTRKLEKSLEVNVSQTNKAIPASPLPCEFAGFDCWTAKDFVWDERPYLLFMNVKTRFTLVVSVVEYIVRSVPYSDESAETMVTETFKDLLHLILDEYHTKPDAIERYLELLGNVSIAYEDDLQLRSALNHAQDYCCRIIDRWADTQDGMEGGVILTKMLSSYLPYKSWKECEKEGLRFADEVFFEDLAAILDQSVLKPGAVTCKVSLNLGEYQAWRRFIISSHASLFEVHCAIQELFQWENCHLFQFEAIDETGEPVYFGIPNEDDFGDVLDARDYPFGKALDRAWKLTYDYDFGDGWEHNLIRESVDADATLLHPKPLGGKGLAPEEDSGGIGGHLENLHAAGIAISTAAEKDIGSHVILI